MRADGLKRPLHEAVKRACLVCDGAMGTQLMAAGLEQGACGEYWNLSHPERVLAIHRAYAEAGADCLISNTFGASRTMLQRHNHAGDLRAINAAGVRIAREAFGERTGYVLGDMGPLGAILEPFGEMSQAEALAAYEEQAGALVEGGADAIIIETQTSLDEMGIAIEAAQRAGAASIIASFAYDLSQDQTFYVTMMGVMPEAAAALVQERGAHVVALNCGTGMDMAGAARVAWTYREHCELPIMVQPNAGLPVLENLKAVYKQSASEVSRRVPAVIQAGARIIGSCCGSTPEYTRGIAEEVRRERKTAGLP